jgi:drug/metabolite transporter (DMT)-like permease
MPRPRLLVIAAFLAVYLIWGSTYLGIKFAIESLPPFLMAGARFVTAGSILLLIVLSRGATRPTLRQVLGASIVGLMLLCYANGCVVWAEENVPSGMTALLVATLPLWMVLIDWLRPGGERPRLALWIGVMIGLAGVGALVDQGWVLKAETVDPWRAAGLLSASLVWALGSIYSRHSVQPKSAWVAAAVQMLAGGAGLFAWSALTGEWSAFDTGSVTWKSLSAWAYLVVFGSLVAFSAYTYILKVSTPAKVATYAYVNPIVAVFLGWLAGEAVTQRTVVGSVVIIAAVAFITQARTGGARISRAPEKQEAKAPEARADETEAPSLAEPSRCNAG